MFHVGQIVKPATEVDALNIAQTIHDVPDDVMALRFEVAVVIHNGEDYRGPVTDGLIVRHNNRANYPFVWDARRFVPAE